MAIAALAAVGLASSARAEPSARSTEPSTALAASSSEPRGVRGSPAGASRRDDAGVPVPGVTRDGKIVLNVATSEELMRLPGVGKRRAEAILGLRTKLVRFRRLSQLLRVRGIGRKSLKRIEPLVVLDPPEASRPDPSDGGAG